MPENKLVIPIELPDKKIDLYLFGENIGETLSYKEDAPENGESPYQITEGCSYEYKITGGYNLSLPDIVTQSKVNKSAGRISPNIYVGTLCIDILDPDGKRCGEVKIEARSVKTSYRDDYRLMLEEITEKCTELILQHSSPVSQILTVDFNADARTLYQRFAFIRSVLDSAEFNDAFHKIISSPVTRWEESEIIKDIRGLRRFRGSVMRQLTGSGNRVDMPPDHPLKETLKSVPSKIKVNYKTETVDTPENRFVKHALFIFLTICDDFQIKVKDNSRIKTESGLLVDKLQQFLSHSVFKDISVPETLPLNSPVLQRKEGYREILRVWLMVDLAAKLIWHGGDDVYSGNKRDVAVLYEYWLFFKLLDIIEDVFRIKAKPADSLIQSTSDGLGLQLKQGKYLPVEGVYTTDTRKLNIQFGYNKTFSGAKKYPEGGSWTRNLRPDYTLSVWPYGIGQEQAELEELIVHIHFDAKYKIENLQTIFGKVDNLDQEKEEQRKGTYKRADLLKMHTYKDAIRRTAGAYVLYPGTDKYAQKGFHEIIPGLGAFAVRPSKVNDGTDNLKIFLNEVVAHFLNRASHREKISLKTYETYKNSQSNEVRELLPETHGPNRTLIPDETYVLVGYYKGKEHWDWIIRSGLYNARAGSKRGSLRLGPGESGAKYLLLHTEGETKTGNLFDIVETGPRIFSKQKLIEEGYPTDPTQNYYLVYKVKKAQEMEFGNKKWDITKLSGYQTGRTSALPFSVTMTDLMSSLINRQ